MCLCTDDKLLNNFVTNGFNTSLTKPKYGKRIPKRWKEKEG
jgi:hypothetical protein